MANYIDGYYYTVTAYEAEGSENVPDTASTLSNWIPLAKSKTLNTKNKALYRVVIYDATAGLPGFIVRDDRNVTVTVTTSPLVTRIDGPSKLLSSGEFATFKTAVKDIADISSIRTIDDRYYDFTVTPKKAGTVSPKLEPQVQINGIWRDVRIQTNAKIPSVIFTKAPTAPPVPTQVDAYDPYGKTGPYQYRSCNKKFLRLWHSNVKEVPVQGKAGTTVIEYTVSIKYFNSNGDPDGADVVLSKQVNGKTINREKATESHVPGSLTQLANRMLDEAKNCNSTGGNNNNNNTPAPQKTPESVKKANNFNPYPHIATRHFSSRVTEEAIGDEKTNPYDQLAYFYVDPDVVSLPDKKLDLLPGGKAAELEKLWGFRFLFNPQYISFNMNSNNQVDWSRPNENNAQLVASGIGGSITLNILLDRVADMASMKQWQKNGGGEMKQGNYPVSMDAEQCAGILHRGTEYDLEYLFRVLNGNPQKVILMGDDPKDGLEVFSANMGYLTQLPFIFKISERQRYKVIMQSISVEHSMFTRDMVPIRSVIQINLERLPDITSGKFSNFKQAESINLITPLTAAGRDFIPLDRRGAAVKK
jgi:hypothetical protein